MENNEKDDKIKKRYNQRTVYSCLSLWKAEAGIGFLCKQ